MTLHNAYGDTPAAEDHETAQLRRVAANWTDRAAAELAVLDRVAGEQKLTPAMRMQRGYLESARTAHDKLNEK